MNEEKEYIWLRLSGNNKYEGIRVASEVEHNSDAYHLEEDEFEICVMGSESLDNKSHEEICDLIMININRLFIFSEDDSEQLLEDVRSLTEGFI